MADSIESSNPTVDIRKRFTFNQIVTTPLGLAHVLGVDPRTHLLCCSFEKPDYVSNDDDSEGEEKWKVVCPTGGHSTIKWFGLDDLQPLEGDGPEREVKQASLIHKRRK